MPFRVKKLSLFFYSTLALAAMHVQRWFEKLLEICENKYMLYLIHKGLINKAAFCGAQQAFSLTVKPQVCCLNLTQ